MTDVARRVAIEVYGHQATVNSVRQGRLDIDALDIPWAGVLDADLLFEKGEHRVRLAVRGQLVRDASDSFEMESEPDTMRLLAAALDWFKGEDLVARSLVSEAARVRPRTEHRSAGRGGPRRAVQAAVLATACLVVGAYVSQRVLSSLQLPANSAFVTARTEALVAPATGSIAFLSEAAEVTAGEPVVGIETRGGASVTTDAPRTGAVIARHVRFRDTVRRGDPIMSVAEGGASPFVLAFVDGRDLLRLSAGSSAVVTLPDGKQVEVPVGAENIYSSLANVDGTAQIGLRLSVPGLNPVAIGRLVNVRFKFSSLLSGALNRI